VKICEEIGAKFELVRSLLAEGAAHDPVCDAVAGLPVMIVRGSEHDVLQRSAAATRGREPGPPFTIAM